MSYEYGSESKRLELPNPYQLQNRLLWVCGAVLLIGWPKVASGLAKTNLRSSRTTVANMFAKARAFAMQSNRRTFINFNGSNVVITASPLTLGGVGNTVDSIGGVEKLSETYGVTLTAPVPNSLST